MSNDIDFERDFEFEYGVAQQVSPMIRRVIANNPSAYTHKGTGTYILGHGEVAVVDPGPLDDTHLAALLAALEGETVSHILITHTHRDHSPLAAALKLRTGASTYAYGPHGSGRQAASGGSGDVRLDAGGDLDFTPDVTVDHGDVIEGRGWRAECVFTPGHTSNHMSFAVPQEQTLLCGDHVMAWNTSVIAPPDGNMADYMASLHLLLEREETLMWPTHGPPIGKPHQFVRAYVTHRMMREAAILKLVQRGERTISDIVKIIYSELDPRMHPAAGMSVLAHMEHLIEQEKIETDGGARLDSEYRAR
jgi:glyoxylase-like metal-dependent hydrolase (beta-lactamase superfamily II)